MQIANLRTHIYIYMKKILILSAIALSLTLTGCDIAKKIGIGNDGNATKNVVTSTADKQTNAAIASKNSSAQTTVDISGEWTIIGVNNKEINSEDDMPYVTFVPAEHRFYASNGCNILNGDYTLNGSSISFSQVLATQKICSDLNYDGDITRIFAGDQSFTVQLKVQDETTFLYFIDSKGSTVITLSRQNLSWLNGQWDVVSVSGSNADPADANIFLDIPSLRVHGNTGCNYFNGTIHVDPLKAGSISFSGMGVTRMACPDQDFERAMLVALEQVTDVKHVDGKALLTDDNGNTLITLKPAVQKGE